METVFPLGITRQEFDDIKECQAVVIREYERADGSRFAGVVAWGGEEEMSDQADSRGRMYIVPVGLSIVCQKMVRVADLLEVLSHGSVPD